MLATRTSLEVVIAATTGALVGGLGSYAQHYVLGSARLPVGVLLGVAVTGSAAMTVRGALGSRASGPAFALGWLAVVLAASSPRREGDVVVPSDGRGWAFLVGGALVLGLTCIRPALRSKPALARPPARVDTPASRPADSPARGSAVAR